MKLDEADIRLLLAAVLSKTEAAEQANENPFAWTRIAQKLRDELARKVK